MCASAQSAGFSSTSTILIESSPRCSSSHPVSTSTSFAYSAILVGEPFAFLSRDLLAHLVFGQLSLASLAAIFVLRLEHLLDVLHLQLDLGLVRACGAPVEDVRSRARIEPADQDESENDNPDSAQDHEREGVHDAQYRKGGVAFTVPRRGCGG